MIDMLPVLLPVLFLGSVFSAVAGGGLGIIMLVTFTLFFDVKNSVVLMSLVGLIIQAAKILHFHDNVDRRLVLRYAALGIPASYTGGLMLFSLPTRLIEICIAMTCLVFIGLRQRKQPFTITPTRNNVVLCGAINGLQGGMVGLGNFLRNPFLLAMGLSKERFVGTSAVIALLLNIPKVIAYVPNITWTTDLMISLLLSAIPVFLGVAIGRRVLTQVSKATFERALLLVIAVGALKILVLPT